jgi:hypothetical protein
MTAVSDTSAEGFGRRRFVSNASAFGAAAFLGISRSVAAVDSRQRSTILASARAGRIGPPAPRPHGLIPTASRPR